MKIKNDTLRGGGKRLIFWYSLYEKGRGLLKNGNYGIHSDRICNIENLRYINYNFNKPNREITLYFSDTNHLNTTVVTISSDAKALKKFLDNLNNNLKWLIPEIVALNSNSYVRKTYGKSLMFFKHASTGKLESYEDTISKKNLLYNLFIDTKNNFIKTNQTDWGQEYFDIRDLKSYNEIEFNGKHYISLIFKTKNIVLKIKPWGTKVEELQKGLLIEMKEENSNEIKVLIDLINKQNYHLSSFELHTIEGKVVETDKAVSISDWQEKSTDTGTKLWVSPSNDKYSLENPEERRY